MIDDDDIKVSVASGEIDIDLAIGAPYWSSAGEGWDLTLTKAEAEAFVELLKSAIAKVSP